MSKVFQRINVDAGIAGTGFFDFGQQKLVAEAVWKLFYEARKDGFFEVKILFFKKDFSSKVAEKLTEWFGPDPLGGR
jgi:hypothetical protein